ncbi:beta-taxilin [Arctopsyche grandis]|uniref:beta-taxilin n=1 Tax=Arctopsyche grandis TaxID=121162 RepID=UPI00406D80F6
MSDKAGGGVAAEAANVVDECVKLANNIPSKKNSKEPRKIDERSAEHVLKSLSSCNSTEEKLSALCKKYTEVAEENKKLHLTRKQWEKKYVLILRDKDQIQSEYNKTLLFKCKLENLCRELQRQIKTVKEESLIKIKEEEEKRRETLAMFQNTISEVTTAMQQNNEKNSKLRDDNLDMTEKFKTIMEQYELREHQVDKISKQMALESQLSEAKLAKANLEAQAEKEKLLAEKKHLLVELTQYQSRCNDLQSTEVALRSQIAMYTDKYDEFQNALTKSNEVFGGFKGEMEKMSKKAQKQEKESLAWKQRWEKSHTALIDMATEKQQIDSTCALQTRQLMQLQRLCRTMQAERTILLNTLQENNIERPPLPQLPPEPKSTRTEGGVDKVDLMAANCAQLKQSLSQLQGQLNDLTNKKALDASLPKVSAENTTENPKPNPPTQKKSKKGKGKKSKANQNETGIENESQNLPEVVDDVSIETQDIENNVPDNLERLVIPPECPLAKNNSDIEKESSILLPTENVDVEIVGNVSTDSVTVEDVSTNDVDSKLKELKEPDIPKPMTNGSISPKEMPSNSPSIVETAKVIDTNEILVNANESPSL